MSAFRWCSRLRSHFLSPLTFSLAHNDCALSSLLTNPHSLVALCWHFQPSTKISRADMLGRLHILKDTIIDAGSCLSHAALHSVCSYTSLAQYMVLVKKQDTLVCPVRGKVLLTYGCLGSKVTPINSPFNSCSPTE